MLASLITLVGVALLFIFNQSIDPMLVNLVMENDLKDLIHEDPYEFTLKRVKKSKLVLFSLIPWSYTDFSLWILFVIVIVFIILLKKPYLDLKSKAKKQLSQLKFQFPIWLRQLQILLQSNTVLQSLELSLPNAPLLIQEDLKRLIVGIEKDALSLFPYLEFLKAYRLAEIERAMKLLYRYNTVGKDEAYLQFNRMIQTTTKWLRNERNARNEGKLMAFQWIGMAPLVGVTLLFMAIMFEILIKLFNAGF